MSLKGPWERNWKGCLLTHRTLSDAQWTQTWIGLIFKDDVAGIKIFWLDQHKPGAVSYWGSSESAKKRYLFDQGYEIYFPGDDS